MFSSIRVRLTLWYVLVFGGLLVGFSLFVYAVLSRGLYDRLDHSLSNAAEAMAAAFANEVTENGGDRNSGANEVLTELRLPEVYTAIFEGDRLLASNYPADDPPAELNRLGVREVGDKHTAFSTVRGLGEKGARVAALAVTVGGTVCTVTVAEPLWDTTEQLAAIRRIFYFGTPATLVVAALGGFFLARKSLAPVMAMSEQASLIGAINLHERLNVVNPGDELGRLARVFNGLLARLDDSFDRMRQFMADASHEIRTPLAIIRGEADVALSRNRDGIDYKASLSVIQEEAERLSRLVDDMLALARADAGHWPLKVEDIYLNDLVEECSRAVRALASARGVILAVEPSADIEFRGDEDLLKRVVLNLLNNAIEYTPAGGSVSVKVERRESGAAIVVADNGIGIMPEEAALVFNRFYRADKARSRASGGTGLGLAITKWVVEAHGGSISLISEPGCGSTFTVALPISDAADPGSRQSRNPVPDA